MRLKQIAADCDSAVLHDSCNVMTRRSIAIFDLDGVFIQWDPRLLERKLLSDEEGVFG